MSLPREVHAFFRIVVPKQIVGPADHTILGEANVLRLVPGLPSGENQVLNRIFNLVAIPSNVFPTHELRNGRPRKRHKSSGESRSLDIPTSL